MSVCPHTGITQPECSCSQCLTEQIKTFQPALLQADPMGTIRVTRAAAPASSGTQSPAPPPAAI